ncbi:MAG: transposase [Thioalkalivibrionaceae bacterium]
MPARRHSPATIASAIDRAQRGESVKSICQDLGIAVSTYYLWRSRYNGMRADQIKHVQTLESDQRRLERRLDRLVAKRTDPSDDTQ